MVAEGNNARMEQYFDKGTLEPVQIVEGPNQAVNEMRIFPVLCTSAANNAASDLPIGRSGLESEHLLLCQTLRIFVAVRQLREAKPKVASYASNNAGTFSRLVPVRRVNDALVRVPGAEFAPLKRSNHTPQLPATRTSQTSSRKMETQPSSGRGTWGPCRTCGQWHDPSIRTKALQHP